MHENVTVAKPENRLRYYAEAEKFLAKHWAAASRREDR